MKEKYTSTEIREIQKALTSIGRLVEGSYKEGVLDYNTRIVISELESQYEGKDILDILKSINNTSAKIKKTDDGKILRPHSAIRSTSSNRARPKGFYKRSNFKYDYISCYIQNIRTGSVIDFSLESPESISESTGANFTSTSTKGRSHPWMSYDSSKGKEVSFTLALNEDYCSEGLVTTINKIKALSYPALNSDKIVSPLCRIKLGNTVALELGVITSVQVTWKKPYRDGLYLNAEVSISAEEVVDKSIPQSTAERGY